MAGPEPVGSTLVERLRALHLELVDPVLDGDGLGLKSYRIIAPRLPR